MADQLIASLNRFAFCLQLHDQRIVAIKAANDLRPRKIERFAIRR